MSITVSVPAAWASSAAFDAQTVSILKAAGVPATSIVRGRIILSAGSLSSVINGDNTTYTYTAPVVPPDPKDATIADLQKKVADATTLISQLQVRATAAENLNATLKSQLANEVKTSQAPAPKPAPAPAPKAAPAPAPKAETTK